jgi:hypothetical protein
VALAGGKTSYELSPKRTRNVDNPLPTGIARRPCQTHVRNRNSRSERAEGVGLEPTAHTALPVGRSTSLAITQKREWSSNR